MVRRRNRLKIAGRWVYPYRAFDQYGQVIDVLAAEKRNLAATRRFLARALERAPGPAQVTTDRAPAYPRVVDELLTAACHVMEHYANNQHHRPWRPLWISGKHPADHEGRCPGG